MDKCHKLNEWFHNNFVPVNFEVGHRAITARHIQRWNNSYVRNVIATCEPRHIGIIETTKIAGF